MSDPDSHIDKTPLSAYDYLQSGNLAEAEGFCRGALCIDPRDPKALHVLALVLCAKAEYETAHDLMEEAIGVEPDNHFFHYTMGDVLRGLYQHADAVDSYKRATALNPAFAPSWNNLGMAYQDLGLFDQALASYEKALLVDPDSAPTHAFMGNLLMEMGRFNEAVSSFQRAVLAAPSFMEAYTALSRALEEMGGVKDGLPACLEAFEADPRGAEVLNNFGTVLQEEGFLEEAMESFTRAVNRDPAFADGFNSLGLIQKRLGRYEDASKSFEHAIELDPGFVEAHNNLGVACYGLGLFEDAKKSFETTIRLKDTYATAHTNLGMIFAEEGLIEAARECYEKADTLEPQPGLKVALATLVPVICKSTEEIEATRTALKERLAALLTEGLVIDDPVRQIGRANFYLAYQGMGDRSLQERLAEFYVKICLGLAYTAPHCQEDYPRRVRDRIKLVIVSRHLKDHTIGKYVKGIIEHLDRNAFEVHTVLFPNKKDETVEFIESRSDSVVTAPESFAALRRLVAGMEADILFYPDIGMEPYTYFLAMSRLAPVQCVFYGHPITTGIRNVDYFISHEGCETPGSDAHYTEKLVTLPKDVAYTYFSRPELKGPEPKRADFSLPDSAHLYLCCQSLFKVHPDFDGIVKTILAEDPDALVIFFHGKHASWADLLRTRLAGTLGKESERVMFLPRHGYDDYLKLVALADVALDTTHFNGGATTFDALAVGTPVVTLPGEFMRGRQTYALYQRMGLMDCVARTPEEYAQIAVRLATDPSRRTEIKDKILALAPRIFEDLGMVRELQQLLKGMARNAGIMA